MKLSRSFTIVLCLFTLSLSYADRTDAPVFVAQIPNPNDYSLFANGGWDGNWYVGYNNGWVKKLPPVPKGNYSRAYIGAKLGRMKTLPPEGRPPEFNPVPGEVWTALSPTPVWKSEQRLKLTSTEDIPLEPGSEYALENVGESEWFWSEIPLASVNLSGENYMVLWSTTAALVSVSSGPILAAAWGNKDINTWTAKEISGEPPPDAKSATATGISYFQPAMALKLIPAGAAHPMQVRLLAWQNGSPAHLKPVISASVAGESIERVWIEYDVPHRAGDVIHGQWIQIGRSVWKAPYTFSLDQSRLPQTKVFLRVAACNIWEEKTYSDPFEVEVTPVHATK